MYTTLFVAVETPSAAAEAAAAAAAAAAGVDPPHTVLSAAPSDAVPLALEVSVAAAPDIGAIPFVFAVPFTAAPQQLPTAADPPASARLLTVAASAACALLFRAEASGALFLAAEAPPPVLGDRAKHIPEAGICLFVPSVVSGAPAAPLLEAVALTVVAQGAAAALYFVLGSAVVAAGVGVIANAGLAVFDMLVVVVTAVGSG